MAKRLIQGTVAGFLAAASIIANAALPSAGESSASSGSGRIKAPTAWQKGATGRGIVIAVIDSGVNAGHRDLAGHLLTGYNALNGSTQTGDGNGHGTHVTGILGALSNGTGIVGVAYDAKILPVKIFDANGNGSAESLSSGIRYTAGKADILNLSLGAAGPVSESALRGAVAGGQLVVAAAGNEGLANTDWPARYAKESWALGRIIAVGAVDANNRIAAWSNRAGVTKNFYLVAPGTTVLSTYKSGYAYMSGTSMATPYVSGAAAAVWSNWPYLTATQVANVLFKSATDLGAAGIDATYGRGLVNLERALQPIGTTSIKTASTSTTTTSTSGTWTKVSSLSTWVGGTAYASSLYSFAQGGGFTVAATDELGRDFQIDLGGLVAEPAGMTIEGMFDQMNQQMSLTEQVLADGSRLTLAPNSIVPTNNYAFNTDDATIIPGGFALTTQLANGDAWGVGTNSFGDRFFGLGSARFAHSPALDAAAFANPLFGYVSQHSHLGYAFGLDHGMNLRVGLLTDGLNTLYAPAGNEYEAGSSNLWTAELSQQTAHRYLSASVTQLREDEGLLGSQQDALFGLNTSAVTTAVSMQGAWRLAPCLALAGRYTVGYTPAVDAHGNGLVTDISTMRTEAFALGLAQADALRKGDRMSVTVSQPLRASSGAMHFDMPIGNNAEGQMQYAARALDLKSSGRELRTELNYVTPLGRDQELGVSLAHRDQPDHDANAAADNMIAVRWGMRF